MTTSDKRGDYRQRVLKDGKLVFHNRAAIIDCTIRDLTSSGARVRIRETPELPLELELLIPSQMLIFPATRLWQRGADVGLRFIGPARAAPPRNW